MSSTAPAPAIAPLLQEGNRYWQEFVEHCEKHVTAINAIVDERALTPDHRVTWRSGKDLCITKSAYPSTTVTAKMVHEPWGPVICGAISGQEDGDVRFSPEEFEVPIARDLDGGVVAVFDEGRSLSPRELACYVTQRFRRCYPGVSLPC